MNNLRVGVIGLGVGEQHIYGFRSAGVHVAALCDMDPLKKSMALEKFPECTFYDNYQDLLEYENLDIVSIASYDNDHATQIVSALDSGSHVFCEKPLCISNDELISIRRALARNTNLRISTNTVLRMSQRFRDIQERVAKGELGTIYYVEADYNYGRLEKITHGWRGEMPNYSVMLGGGIHMVDLLLWFVGSPVIEVSAVGNKLCSSNSNLEAPDMVLAWLKFENGVIGKVSANFGCVYPHFHDVKLFGTQATFLNGVHESFIISSRDPKAKSIPITTPYPGLSKGDLIPSFVDSVLGRGSPIVDEQAVFSSMATCLAINRSLQTGKSQSVELHPFS